ncbi:hypothetical protein [Caldimonas tepidiphila]|uniref:hypothetical protein n=1 Tax=Caldimonas tepidiphila TaxID=2315841 RepID=UPI0013001C08|nr:hypothetical protein [Caldimonas tepidiphila]
MNTTTQVLSTIAESLRRAGATLPAPESDGTVETAIKTGLSIALCVVEQEARRAMAQSASLPRLKSCDGEGGPHD